MIRPRFEFGSLVPLLPKGGRKARAQLGQASRPARQPHQQPAGPATDTARRQSGARKGRSGASPPARFPFLHRSLLCRDSCHDPKVSRAKTCRLAPSGRCAAPLPRPHSRPGPLTGPTQAAGVLSPLPATRWGLNPTRLWIRRTLAPARLPGRRASARRPSRRASAAAPQPLRGRRSRCRHRGLHWRQLGLAPTAAGAGGNQSRQDRQRGSERQGAIAAANSSERRWQRAAPHAVAAPRRQPQRGSMFRMCLVVGFDQFQPCANA